MSSIFGVGSSSQTDSVQSLASLLQNTQTAAGTSTSSSNDVSGAASTDFSPQSQILSKLQSLATSDPAKFKQVTAAFADKLNQLAQKIGGTAGANLSKLADKFTQASQTGDASALQPKASHHHGGAHKAYSQDSSQSLTSLLSSTSTTDSQQQEASLFQQLTQSLTGSSATA